MDGAFLGHARALRLLPASPRDNPDALSYRLLSCGKSRLAVAGGGHRGRDMGTMIPLSRDPGALRAALMTMSAVA
jgi:hypothetical protein